MLWKSPGARFSKRLPTIATPCRFARSASAFDVGPGIGSASASDRESRAKIAGELQQYVLEQGYFIPLNQLVQRLYLISPKVQGVSYNGLAYANFYTAWISG